MKKVLAFAGSNHSQSINYQLVEFTASLFSDMEVKVFDLRHWDIAMYSIDMDPDQTPEKITKLIALLAEYDGFIISSPEHNGGTPAFFKNILDWLSRRSKGVFGNKPVLLMSTSPGKGGAATNLNYLNKTLPYQGANIVSTFSLPSFNENFQDGKITDNEQLKMLNSAIEVFCKAVIG